MRQRQRIGIEASKRQEETLAYLQHPDLLTRPQQTGRAQCRACHARAARQPELMLYLAVNAAVSGVLIAAASEMAKRYPGFGALIASLPLVSILGMIWLWRDKPDAANMSAHVGATFWFVLPSLPMFLAILAMLDRGVPFSAALTVGCLITVALYSLMVWAGPRFGLPL